MRLSKLCQRLAFAFSVIFMQTATIAGSTPFQPQVSGSLNSIELRLSETNVFRGDFVEAVVLAYDIEKRLVSDSLNGTIYINGQKRDFTIDNGFGVIDITTSFLFEKNVTVYAQVNTIKSARTDLTVFPRNSDNVEINELHNWKLNEFSINSPKIMLSPTSSLHVQDGITATLMAIGDDATFSLYHAMKLDGSFKFDVLNYNLKEIDRTSLYFNGQSYPLSNIVSKKLLGDMPVPQFNVFAAKEYLYIVFFDLSANDGGFIPDGIPATLVAQKGAEIITLDTQTQNGRAEFNFAPLALLNTDVFLLIEGRTFAYELKL